MEHDDNSSGNSRVPLPLHLSSFGYAPSFSVNEARDLIDGGNLGLSSSASTPDIQLSFTPSSPLRFRELKRIDDLNKETRNRQNQDAFYHLHNIKARKLAEAKQKQNLRLSSSLSSAGAAFLGAGTGTASSGHNNTKHNNSNRDFNNDSFFTSINNNDNEKRDEKRDDLRVTNVLPPPFKPAVTHYQHKPSFRVSSVLGSSVYKNEETHRRLVVPPWMAIANATRCGATGGEMEAFDFEYDPTNRIEGERPYDGDEAEEEEEDRPMSPPSSPFQPKLPKNTAIYLHGEKAQASVSIQKSWRGFISRVRIWRFGGKGTHHMATKIQRRYRGVLGRRKAANRWLERDEEKANAMIALYWGFKGRKIARVRRVEIWANSASMIQRNYRGRLGKKMFAIHKERVMNKKAAFLQRCYRGSRGRVKTTLYRKRLSDGREKMERILKLHGNNELWENIFDKDGDGEEDESPPEDELLDAALTLLCVQQDYENARLYVRDALRFYPESPRALIIYATILHIVWDAYGFLKVPRPDILNEALEITQKVWELDPKRECFREYEVEYFQNARRMRPFDPRRLCNYAVMLHVAYGSFDTSKEERDLLPVIWSCNKRADNLFKRSIELDDSCKYPQVRSIAKAFRALYKAKRVVCTQKPKGFPIGEKGKKIMFNLTIYKCIDQDGTDLDRREKLVCHAVEKPLKKTIVAGGSSEAVGEGAKEEGKTEMNQETGQRKTLLLKSAVQKQVITHVLKKDALKVEQKFDIKEKRKVKKAENEKKQTQSEIERYRAHVRLLNLKTNTVARDFVVHEEEWRALLGAAVAQEKRGGRPATMVDEDARKDPMKVVAEYISGRLCIRSVYDSIEEERQRVLVLPEIQGMRDLAVAEMIEDNAARRLQRIFRGFQGRAQIRRMIFRFKMKEKSEDKVAETRHLMALRRQKRALCCCLVQARIKGMLWRRRLARMRGASTVIQTAWRGFSCRMRLREAERKEKEGARVDVVYKRGRVVSGIHVFLEVKRCGLSFKFIGRSEVHMETFFGYVYREDCLKLIERHNEKVRREVERLKALEGAEFDKTYAGYDRRKETDEVKQIHDMQALLNRDKKTEALKKEEDDKLKEIKEWQYERILGLLLDGLALVDPIKSSSNEIQRIEGSKVFIVEINLGSSAHGHGILVFDGQKRYLRDQKKTFMKYHKELKGRQNKQKALGIAVDTW